jgi:hypothetical protein
MQPRVFGFVDNTHSATTQAFNDAVVRNGLAYHGPSGDGLLLCRAILGGLVVAVNRVLGCERIAASEFAKEASQTRDYCVAKNAT